MLIALPVTFRMVIQYVKLVLEARSTATSHSTWGAPTTGEVETTVHTTCQATGQPNVNHRRDEPAGTEPVNCVPTTMTISFSQRRGARSFASLSGPTLLTDRAQNRVCRRTAQSAASTA